MGQVVVVRRHHHHLPGLEAEQLDGPEIGLRVRLVMVEVLRRQHAVPRQAGVLAHVDQTHKISVRQGRQHVSGLQPRQPRHRVRPPVEPVPDAVEVVLFRFRPSADAVPGQEFLQLGAVNVIDVGPRNLSPADAVHAGTVGRFPVVDEGLPVHRKPLRLAQGPGLGDDAGAPVDDRAEHVEGQRLHRGYVHRHFPLLFTCHPPGAPPAGFGDNKIIR